MNIIAVVVTYNRLNLLKKAIAALKQQTQPLSTILVVNNGSTDGTEEWLAEQQGIVVITQENIGGSGGFWRGIKEAYAMGADYIWCMDDDVHPYDDCLAEYMKVMPSEGGVLAPRRLLAGNEIVYGGECLHFNLSNPFAPLKFDAHEAEMEQYDNTMPVEAIAFEGPIFSRNVVEKIGLPEKGLFIFWDDTEYSYRAHVNGFKVLYVKSARLFKEDLVSHAPAVAARSWKYPYMLRNETFFVHRYAKLPARCIREWKLFLQYFIGVAKHLMKSDGKYCTSDFTIVWRAFRDGVNGRLGKY